MCALSQGLAPGRGASLDSSQPSMVGLNGGPHALGRAEEDRGIPGAESCPEREEKAGRTLGAGVTACAEHRVINV